MECAAECTYSCLLSYAEISDGAGCTEHKLFIVYNMKLQGYLKGTGKVGNLVTSINSGVCIGREYNPNVTNPNTPAQVSQRARFKLMSQLGASLSEVLAFSKKGLVSARNRFVQANNDYVTSAGGTAQVSYENLQLADGNRGLPAIQATRQNETGVSLSLLESAAASCSRVVYVVGKKSSEQQIQIVNSVVVSDAGVEGNFPVSIPYIDGELIIYAYGMKDNNAAAAAKFGNYNVATGQDIATLIYDRRLSASDYTFTQTRGTTLFNGEGSVITPDAGQVMIYITAAGNGTVAGTGFTGNRKAVDVGESVTVTATPNQGSTFVGWKLNGSSSILSTEQTYTFTAQQNTDLIAQFHTEGFDPDNTED